LFITQGRNVNYVPCYQAPVAQGIINPAKAEVGEKFLRLNSVPMDTLLQPASIGFLAPIQDNRP
jgi:hypothetical protein